MRIEVKDITKKYGAATVLDGVSFCAESGMRVGILGSNGSGKSTLLSILAGIQPADGGSFRCEQMELLGRGSGNRGVVGYVPQGMPFLEELTAWDNLRLWYSHRELKEELDSGVLAMLGIGEFVKKPVWKLSGGMKKRLSIGCAMAGRPPILLMDEPSAALDLVCKAQIHSWLAQYQMAGGIVVLATHDLQELESCDKLYILKAGKLQPYTYEKNLQDLMERL